MSDEHYIKTQVELLKRDFGQLSNITAKLDITIDKLSQVSTSLDRMIAVHENRLEYHDQIDKELFTLIEDRRKESKEQYEGLHHRVGKMRDEFDTDLATAIKELTNEFRDLKERDAAFHLEVTDRLHRLEKWRWVVTGAAIAAGFMFAKMDVITKIFS